MLRIHQIINHSLVPFSLLLIVNAFLSSAADVANTNPQETALNPDTSSVFSLGTVVVTGSEKKQQNKDVVNSAQMKEFGRTDVARALSLLPGVNVSDIGPRNESQVYVRGFDLRSVPLYIDGVPIYVPYDGYVDLGRFTTFDYSEIKVEKGYSSVLYGPNAIGGAINLVTRKPVHKFELQADVGTMGYVDTKRDSTLMPHLNGSLMDISAGSRLGKFFLMGAVSDLDKGNYELSKAFTPTPLQSGGLRTNSYHRDAKASAKIGWDPAPGDEYVLSYDNQHGEKGVPPTVDPTGMVRYWYWPYWDKQSVYLSSKTVLSNNFSLKVPVYYNELSNSLFACDDSSYSTFKKRSSFMSYYDDWTAGGAAELGTTIIPGNEMSLAFHGKRDYHQEHNVYDTAKVPNSEPYQAEPLRHFKDNTFSLGLEDGATVLKILNLTGGVSYDYRSSVEADNFYSHYNGKIFQNVFDSIVPFPSNNAQAFNAEGKAAVDINGSQNASISVARKTRFPTLKDRYSYKLGTAILNPTLQPENAVNCEAAYDAGLNMGTWSLAGHVSLFYTHLYNAIQSVDSVIKAGVLDANARSQMQNTGEAEMPGFELSLDATVLHDVEWARALEIGANASYLNKHNLSHPAIKFTDIPRGKGFGYVKYTPITGCYALASVEYDTWRYTTSQGSTVPEFILWNASLNIPLGTNVSLEGGVRNAFDKNYSLEAGYPEEGRTFFVNLHTNFNVD